MLTTASGPSLPTSAVALTPRISCKARLNDWPRHTKGHTSAPCLLHPLVRRPAPHFSPHTMNVADLKLASIAGRSHTFRVMRPFNPRDCPPLVSVPHIT